MTHTTRVVLFLLTALLVLLPVAADEYHYINTFVGDRAAGMAGAYTAIADGPEGMYYNPAGLAFAPSNYVSVSTNAFEFRNWTFEDVEGFGVDFERDSFTFVPNFFGFVQRGEDMVWGFTLFSSDNEQINLRDSFEFELVPGAIIQTKFYNEDRVRSVTSAGPAFGWLLGDLIGVGFSVFGTLEQEETIQRDTDRFIDVDGTFLQSQQETTSQSTTFFLSPSIGTQYLVSEVVSLGVSAFAKVPIVSTAGQAANRTYYEDPDLASRQAGLEALSDGIRDAQGYANANSDFTTERQNIWEDELFATLDLGTRIGIAWFASQRLIVAADASYVYPVNPDDVSTEAEFQPTWNVSAGLEYYLTQNFPVRFGLFTNNANTDEVDSGETDQPEHVDMYGATASIGFATADIVLNLGGAFSYGVGKGQLIGGTTDTQTLTRRSSAVFISGGYQF